MRQAVFFTGERALGIDLETGHLLWSYDKAPNGTANIATPIVRGNRVFLSSGYGTGAALLELTPGNGGERPARCISRATCAITTRAPCSWATHLYGFSDAILTAMQFDTGKVAWRDRSVGKGSMVFADERLYLYSENGVVGLAEATPAGYREHGRFEISAGRLPTWSHPVVSGGRLFIRDQDTILCLRCPGEIGGFRKQTSTSSVSPLHCGTPVQPRPAGNHDHRPKRNWCGSSFK